MKCGNYELVEAPSGYPGKLYRGKYAYQHHTVWWEHNMTVIPQGYVVHHKNGACRDNSIGNLQLLTKQKHSALHGALQEKRLSAVCGYCEEEFSLPGAVLRKRLKASTSGNLFCSRSHQVKQQRTDRRNSL